MTQLFLMKKYYKMFFLITHILIGKYYPNLFTQFIIGCTFYVLTYLIIKDIIPNIYHNQYKNYAITLIIADASFMIFRAKKKIDSKKINKQEEFNENKEKEQITTDLKTGSIHSITLSSEINDYKITHELSLSDSDIKKSIFSTSDEKSDINKNNSSNLSNSSSSNLDTTNTFNKNKIDSSKEDLNN